MFQNLNLLNNILLQDNFNIFKRLSQIDSQRSRDTSLGQRKELKMIKV